MERQCECAASVVGKTRELYFYFTLLKKVSNKMDEPSGEDSSTNVESEIKMIVQSLRALIRHSEKNTNHKNTCMSM